MATAAPPDLREHEYAALAQFRYLVRRFLGFSERAAVQAGLEPRQYQLLLALRGLGRTHAATISEIAEWLQVRHHTAVELTDRAAARGLVERHPDSHDRRRVLVALTARGQAALGALAVVHRDELRQVVPTLVTTLQQFVEPTGGAST